MSSCGEDTPKSKTIPIIIGIIIALLLFLIGYIVVTEYISPKDDTNVELTLLEN